MPKPEAASSVRNLKLPWTGAVLTLAAVAVAVPAWADAQRERALEYYEQAQALRQQIESLPEAERTPAAYRKVVDAFRRVYFTTPHSSKADDSLLAVGEIYVEMSRRFGSAAHREKAAEAYRFLFREYPYSPFRAQAREKLEELNSPAPAAASRPPEAEPARPEPPEDSSQPPLPQITGVRHWSFPGLTRIVVDLEAEVSFRSERLTGPDRVYFDLPNTRLSPALKGKTLAVGDEIVKQIRIAQNQVGVTRVVLDLNSDSEHSVSVLANPPRVVVELRQRTAAAKSPAGPVKTAELASPPVAQPKATPPVAAPPKSAPEPPELDPPKAEPPKAARAKAAQANSRGERNLIRALGLKVARVVIDAGHGGHDTGTIGPTGLMEKELALDVATRLGALVSERIGSEVILTRTDDTFVSLEDRTALANEKQADLFISIHANSSKFPHARGIETYYLNLTADREALEVAARENAASRKSIHDLQDLVTKITLTEKIAESREFAGQVQRSLYGAMSKENAALRNRGVRKAPFVVLIGARMPSVLAEVSFISNPRDEKLLKTPAWRQKIAEALFNGLAGYSRTLSRVEVAAK